MPGRGRTSGCSRTGDHPAQGRTRSKGPDPPPPGSSSRTRRASPRPPPPPPRTSEHARRLLPRRAPGGAIMISRVATPTSGDGPAPPPPLPGPAQASDEARRTVPALHTGLLTPLRRSRGPRPGSRTRTLSRFPRTSRYARRPVLSWPDLVPVAGAVVGRRARPRTKRQQGNRGVAPSGTPGMVRVADYPSPGLPCWNPEAPCVTRREAFAPCERNWRWLDVAGAPEHERDFIDGLAREFGRGLSSASPRPVPAVHPPDRRS